MCFLFGQLPSLRNYQQKSLAACAWRRGSWGLSIQSNRRCGDLMDREGFAYYRRHCTGRRNIRKLERVNANEI